MDRIAIFENEYKNVESSFDAVNLLYFDNKLKFEVFKTSQEFGDLERIIDYSCVIVDIDLTAKSELDGYQLISQMLKVENVPKIIVLTGHIDIKAQLEKRNFLPFQR